MTTKCIETTSVPGVFFFTEIYVYCTLLIVISAGHFIQDKMQHNLNLKITLEYQIT